MKNAAVAFVSYAARVNPQTKYLIGAFSLIALIGAGYSYFSKAKAPYPKPALGEDLRNNQNEIVATNDEAPDSLDGLPRNDQIDIVDKSEANLNVSDSAISPLSKYRYSFEID